MPFGLPLPHTELQRRYARLGHKELSENRLVRETQDIGNLFHAHVRTLKQFACIGTNKFRPKEMHRIAGNALHNPRQVSGGNVERIGIKPYAMLHSVIVQQQFPEKAEKFMTAFDVRQVRAITAAEHIGKLQQQQFAQMPHHAVPVKPKHLLTGKQTARFAQYIRLSFRQAALSLR